MKNKLSHLLSSFTNKIIRKGDVSEHWGKKAYERQNTEQLAAISWLDAPIIQKYYVNPRVSESSTINWFEWVVKSYFQNGVDYACNIGCGDGGLERHAFSLKLAKKFDSYDVSQPSIELARNLAKANNISGISYHVADLNNKILDQNKYNVIFASQSLHHIENLERLFKQVDNALVSDGLFVFNEYVGPDRFQWTSIQLKWINSILKILPEKYKRDILHPENLRSEVFRPTIEEMMKVDPSEAVRSSDILPLVKNMFKEETTIPIGGTILHMLLQNIAGNFKEENDSDVALLRLFCTLERELIDSGILPSDFILGIYRKIN